MEPGVDLGAGVAMVVVFGWREYDFVVDGARGGELVADL